MNHQEQQIQSEFSSATPIAKPSEVQISSLIDSMETLAETSWDVIIAGTGLAQSLLALALSRSGKKILHLDQNPYYGGSEAAFSLEEAQEWMNSVNEHPGQSPFEDVKVFTASSQTVAESSDLVEVPPVVRPKLAASRAYTLSLSPYFLYTRSQLISILISSKVYRQLEFMAVGSWWVHSADHTNSQISDFSDIRDFHRVPGNREDIFADTHISMKSKRTLMKFLRHISKVEDEETDNGGENLSMSFGDYLSSNFSVPQYLHNPLISLSLSQLSSQDTTANYAVPRVKRHLASIGALGPGFGAVISKYGGGSEILQIACRASAVGGGIYALNTGIKAFDETSSEAEYPVQVQLSSEESVRTKFVFGSEWDLAQKQSFPSSKIARSISIVSSNFTFLFPVTVEGSPVPASAVLMFPGNTLSDSHTPPVYLQVHSSDTGDCPRQQSIIYGSVNVPGSEGQTLIKSAVDHLLKAEGPQATVLWSITYNQLGRLTNGGTDSAIQEYRPHVYSFPPPSLDLTFEDETIDLVKQAWVKIVGDEVDHDDFMIFDDREGASDE
ncbi:hypothetical protein N7495_007469 [Penicillium taxi]|uniref:uncharacterized protein n=1 Tax=Penicillium taxi TaxID=168475 RepID=UPI00254580E0|nr:uncharacterized protein N7495_007469 [Penicillium taxi]KAJ5887428.1 hypothetical protein N7495_007469 [Penicillium taxi]